MWLSALLERNAAFHPLLPLTEWQNVRSRLSVRAAFGTTCQALRELLLFQEVVHHVGDSVSGSQPHRLPMTAPARPNLALLQAKNNTTRRIRRASAVLQRRVSPVPPLRSCPRTRRETFPHSARNTAMPAYVSAGLPRAPPRTATEASATAPACHHLSITAQTNTKGRYGVNSQPVTTPLTAARTRVGSARAIITQKMAVGPVRSGARSHRLKLSRNIRSPERPTL